MAVETASDRALLLNDFGVTVTFGAETFTAIFDNDYEAVDSGGTVPFAMLRPRILCRSSDVSSVIVGSSFTIGGSTYLVVVIMPDGTGMTEMMLEAQ